jgi:hypothetical protein
VVRVPDFDPERSLVWNQSTADFSQLGKSVWVLDDGAGRRKRALAVYTPPGRSCTAECCVCNIRAPLRNSTWASGVQTGYSEPQRALWTMCQIGASAARSLACNVLNIASERSCRGSTKIDKFHHWYNNYPIYLYFVSFL